MLPIKGKGEEERKLHLEEKSPPPKKLKEHIRDTSAQVLNTVAHPINSIKTGLDNRRIKIQLKEEIIGSIVDHVMDPLKPGFERRVVKILPNTVEELKLLKAKIEGQEPFIALLYRPFPSLETDSQSLAQMHKFFRALLDGKAFELDEEEELHPLLPLLLCDNPARIDLINDDSKTAGETLHLLQKVDKEIVKRKSRSTLENQQFLKFDIYLGLLFDHLMDHPDDLEAFHAFLECMPKFLENRNIGDIMEEFKAIDQIARKNSQLRPLISLLLNT